MPSYEYDNIHSLRVSKLSSILLIAEICYIIVAHFFFISKEFSKVPKNRSDSIPILINSKLK